MLITFNINNMNILSLQFLLLIINDLLIYIIFSIWFLLYHIDIIKSPNPLFAYIITLIYNLLILSYMIYRKISINIILLYIFIILIFKIIPIYQMITYYNLKIDLISIYITIIILLTYILLLIIINNILLHNDINIFKNFKDSITIHNTSNNFVSIDINKN